MTDGIEGIKQKYKEIGEKSGKEIGKEELVIEIICKKLKKNKTEAQIAKELEEDVARVEEICRVAKEFAPDYEIEKIYNALHEKVAV